MPPAILRMLPSESPSGTQTRRECLVALPLSRPPSPPCAKHPPLAFQFVFFFFFKAGGFASRWAGGISFAAGSGRTALLSGRRGVTPDSCSERYTAGGVPYGSRKHTGSCFLLLVLHPHPRSFRPRAIPVFSSRGGLVGQEGKRKGAGAEEVREEMRGWVELHLGKMPRANKAGHKLDGFLVGGKLEQRRLRKGRYDNGKLCVLFWR